MKLTKVQIAILVVIFVVVLMGFAWVNFQGMKKGEAKMPDPGAETRKKYQEEKEKEEGEKDKGKKRTSLIDSEDDEKPKSKSHVIAMDDRGEVSGTLPNQSTLVEPPAPETPMPSVAASQEDTGRQLVDVNANDKTSMTETPRIPTGLFDQRPPEDPQRTSLSTIPPKTRTREGRYLFNNYTDAALRGNTIVYESKGSTVNIESFAPMGEWIDVALMHNAAGNESEIPIVAAVWTPFYFQGRRLLNTGDKILGRGGKKVRDRLMVTFDRVILKSGKSFPIQAIAVDVDGSLGIRGYIVGDLLLQQLGIIASNAASAFMEGMLGKSETVSEGTVAENISGSFERAITNATKEATDKIEEIVQQEVEDKKPYVLVPAGTRARAFLLAPVDISVADYGK